MNEILIGNPDNSFSIRFYNFERSVSVDYFQLNLELVSYIFIVSTVTSISVEDFLLFKRNLEFMLHKQHKVFTLSPLGEFWSIEFLMKEKGTIQLNGYISDTQIPQSHLTFHNVISADRLSEIILQIENVMF